MGDDKDKDENEDADISWKAVFDDAATLQSNFNRIIINNPSSASLSAAVPVSFISSSLFGQYVNYLCTSAHAKIARLWKQAAQQGACGLPPEKLELIIFLEKLIGWIWVGTDRQFCYRLTKQIPLSTTLFQYNMPAFFDASVYLNGLPVTYFAGTHLAVARLSSNVLTASAATAAAAAAGFDYSNSESIEIDDSDDDYNEDTYYYPHYSTFDEE